MDNLLPLIDSLPSLRETVETHGLMAKKSLGQNFLLDRNITDKIIRLSLDKQNLTDFQNSKVYEIGPGPGGLTRSVLRANPDSLTVIEMDERCIKIMQEIQSLVGNRLEIINNDAMKINFSQATNKPQHIVSNLPYNISVPLLTNWLWNIKNFASLTLMFQKEVADRICAPSGNKDYGRLSVLSQLLCKIEKLFDLNPNCFVPAPKIWSSVLLFTPLEPTVPENDLKKVEKITSLAFGQRRKMVRQSLKSIPEIEQKLENIGLNGTLRAEQITPKQYLQLAQSI